MLRLFDFRKTAAGAHDAHHKEQHQQGKADGPYCVMDVDNNAPNRAAFELLRALGDELPDLRQVLVPGIEGIL